MPDPDQSLFAAARPCPLSRRRLLVAVLAAGAAASGLGRTAQAQPVGRPRPTTPVPAPRRAPEFPSTALFPESDLYPKS